VGLFLCLYGMSAPEGLVAALLLAQLDRADLVGGDPWPGFIRVPACAKGGRITTFGVTNARWRLVACMALTWFAGTIYVVGWFGLVLLGLAMLIAIVRSKFDFVQDAVGVFLLLCLPVYHAGRYLNRHLAEPTDLLMWVPAILGGIFGVVLGLQVKNYATPTSQGITN